MTYTESYIKKTAVEEMPSDYQLIGQKLKEGNSAVSSAMSTPVAAEVGWGLIGAGLGATGAYFLSKKLRRDATRRQRALDIVIGAITGLAGSQLILSGGADESGLSTRGRMRADAYLESINKGDRDHNKKYPVTEPFDLNKGTIGGAAGGAFTGGTIGAMFGNLDTVMANRASKKQMALATAQAASAKMAPDKAADYISRYMNQGRGHNAVERARQMGKGFNIGVGGIIGGAGGFGLGVLGNMYARNKEMQEYGGGF